MTVIDDPRYRRLLVEQNELIGFAMSSRFIELELVETQPGWPPDEYIITYTCKGIAGIDGNNQPIYSELHRVSLKFSEHFPMQEPYLKWLTPIWHPNIEHKEPHHVCTDNPKTWWAGKRIVEIVQFMGELVQYQRYYAELKPPFPIDREVAAWVREYAEPNQIVGPRKPVDDRPLLYSSIYRNSSAEETRPEVVESALSEEPQEVPTEVPVATTGVVPLRLDMITFGTQVPITAPLVRVLQGPMLGGSKILKCPQCGEEQTYLNAPNEPKAGACRECGTSLQK
jgi:ubiquitin-protein ligase